MKCIQFGENLETAFSFDNEGKCELQPQFKQALHLAVVEFLTSQAQPPSSCA
jgi:hypothetical protein